MKRTAVLLDLGFVNHRLYTRLRRHPRAEEVRQLGFDCLAPDEEMFRIYCYHCHPYGGASVHPYTGGRIDFATTRQYRSGTVYLERLAALDHVALRSGTLAFDGWRVKKSAVAEIGGADGRSRRATSSRTCSRRAST